MMGDDGDDGDDGGGGDGDGDGDDDDAAAAAAAVIMVLWRCCVDGDARRWWWENMGKQYHDKVCR